MKRSIIFIIKLYLRLNCQPCVLYHPPTTIVIKPNKVPFSTQQMEKDPLPCHSLSNSLNPQFPNHSLDPADAQKAKICWEYWEFFMYQRAYNVYPMRTHTWYVAGTGYTSRNAMPMCHWVKVITCIKRVLWKRSMIFSAQWLNE